MEIKGKVHEVFPTQQVKDTFRKRDLIVEYAENPQYPEYIKFEANNDKCDLLDKVKVGDSVEVFFNLRGRPWTNREGQKVYFTSLNMWRINILTDNGGSGIATSESDAPSAPAQDFSASSDEDDLPF